jgi:hypothetical protein
MKRHRSSQLDLWTKQPKSTMLKWLTENQLDDRAVGEVEVAEAVERLPDPTRLQDLKNPRLSFARQTNGVP